MSKGSGGERLEFFHYSDVTSEHLHRYAIAAKYAEGKKVLDLASGEGYGAFLLSERALSVVGVDIDIQAIQEAKKKYNNTNLNYFSGAADNIPMENDSVDCVVSFETIEHHDKHEAMLLEIKRVLKEDGILIISSPDKKYYSDIPKFQNEFHVKELYFKDFKNLIANNFVYCEFYFQKAYNLSSYIADYKLFNQLIVFSGDNKIITEEPIEPLYNIAIASNRSFKQLEPSIFNGAKISKLINSQAIKNVEEDALKKIKDLESTNSYLLGNFLIHPLFLLKNFFRSRLNKPNE